MSPEDALARIHARTPAVYERRAADWDAFRPRGLREAGWLHRMLRRMPADGPVLDLGCGAGEPILGWWTAQGREAVGLDASAAMLALARPRFPDLSLIRADMRDLDLDLRFAGIVAWDSAFHLNPDELRALIPRMARHLPPGGALMFTTGPEAGEGAGTVGGEPVYHAALDPAELRARLLAAGFRRIVFAPEDPAADRTVLLASRDA